MNHFSGKALLSCKCKLHSFVCYICPYVYTHILTLFGKWHFNNLCSSPLLFPQQGQNMLFSHIFCSKSLGRMKSNICLHLCKNKKRPSNQMQPTWFLWKAGGWVRSGRRMKDQWWRYIFSKKLAIDLVIEPSVGSIARC